MHPYPYFALLALDIARERAAEADAWRLAALARPGEQRPSAFRRAIARVALAVARAADDEFARAPLASR